MVHLVNGPVDGAVVKPTVEPVVPGILHDEEDQDLHGHLPERRERNTIFEAEVVRDGVEEPDLRQFDGAVLEEDEEGAVPLFFPGRNFLLLVCQYIIVGHIVDGNQLTFWILYLLK